MIYASRLRSASAVVGSDELKTRGSEGEQKSETMSRCGSCRLANYCSKKCQAYAWKFGGHRNLCAQSETLLRLTRIGSLESRHF
jgi:radical SAM protein with 4Fe4S-binding SPASM domain